MLPPPAGKPLFGTLVSLVHDGVPILGIIDQPILKERWLGVQGQRTTLNGKEIAVRQCPDLGKAYLYATTPQMFSGQIPRARRVNSSKEVFAGTVAGQRFQDDVVAWIVHLYVALKGGVAQMSMEAVCWLYCSAINLCTTLLCSDPVAWPIAGATETSFNRVRDRVRIPMYGCDCYAYGLLAAGLCDVVCEADLKPYDYMALVPIIRGAGGVITDWQGKALHWKSQSDSEGQASGYPGEVLAAGDARSHQQALELLAWQKSHAGTPPAAG